MSAANTYKVQKVITHFIQKARKQTHTHTHNMTCPHRELSIVSGQRIIIKFAQQEKKFRDRGGERIFKSPSSCGLQWQRKRAPVVGLFYEVGAAPLQVGHHQ